MSKVTTLETNQLQTNPFQPREKVKSKDIDELAQSIRTYGILEPLVVAETPAGYQIIAGERRWQAAKLVGLKEVPVHVRKTTPQGMLEMALVENVQRVNLNPIERAQSFVRLTREFSLSLADLATRIGKSSSYISNTVKLLSLPDAVTDGLVQGKITEGHARALSSIENEEAMVECYKIIRKEKASVRRAEDLARRFKDELLKKGSVTKSSAQQVKEVDETIKGWEKDFNTIFHAPTLLKLSRSKNQTRVTITLKGSPQKTQDDLEKIMELGKL
ncbi:MAG: ParB/RepB/Spo0J family partition protein [Candidatus Pacebacteria bacterium]|jgi:ParB family transcriptional regulator, chromosome partitioning protein|nr:ParB/RepB/Spo0J family partition protein [Candidatus Paceibacterota bacterium]MBT4652087.1 ParB/RepB/Spo0J family partition protein [Candidatus Paceibacterota bacterium]MBT6756109.1 ParB/RepB/Spo0J family partition protein [Candidatus Paceibacterota bacterium]MBT6921702.1 ParB/RepB/Spo0J family partition protein [Candidatus Paceibacterota bacterium]